MIKQATAVAVATMFLIPIAGAASAFPALDAQSPASTNIIKVEWRPHGHFHHGFAGRRFYRGHRYYGGRGIGLGAGLAGLAAGAVIGGALADTRAQYDNGDVASDAEAYCRERFRSYDPVRGTYLGYDGHRHACP